MKKFLLSLVSLIAAAGLNAQITLNQSDVAGVLTLIHQAHDTTHADKPGMINPGSAGANQTWNFSTLTADSMGSLTDTLLFTNPNWFPSGSNFPASNLASLNYTDSSINYLKNNATGLFMDGVWVDIGTGTGPMAIDFNPDFQIVKFPDTYNNSFTNTSKIDFKFYFGQAGIDSIRVKQKIDQTDKTDGWGNLTTPLGMYPSLRHRQKQVNTDTIFVYTAATWFVYQATLDSLWHFEWWAKSVGYTLLSMDSTTADSVRNIQWLKTVPMAGAVHETAAVTGTVAVYPNPATAQVNFEITNADASAIEIFDVNGNKMAWIPTYKNKITYSAESLAQGTYLYRALDIKGNVIGAGKFDVLK